MIAWEQIEDVFLDMDGTLLDLHFDSYFWLEHLPTRYGEIKGVEPQAVRTELIRRYHRMRGTLDWYCLEYWQRELAIDLLPLKLELRDKIRLRPGAQQLLARLAASDKRVCLVSNAHRWSIELKFSQLNLAPFFDHVCSAHDYRTPKEQQDFWHALHRQLDFDPARTLFIDDNTAVLDSARAFGIQHLLSIAKPDSAAPAQPHQGYRLLPDFSELIAACG
ncbi:MAG: GMP/IMP nucleotidase [Cellvibrionales bacterium]|nr:GMP/IMP nucleotidase [Cellvibrionales bacterium]